VRPDFAESFEAVPLYERPCGCEPESWRYLPTGIVVYVRNYPSHHDTLIECRMCGAVWTVRDLNLSMPLAPIAPPTPSTPAPEGTR
jgi:hypothetical protein